MHLSLVMTTLAGLAAALPCRYAEGAADMRQIVENTDRIMASGTVRRGYVEPLQLKGKNFRSALATLLGEEFRCAVTDGPPDVMDLSKLLPAALKCRKEATSIDKLCDILNLEVLPADAQITKRAELLRRFESATVKEVGVFCLAKPRIPNQLRESFERNRATADAKLAERVKSLNLTGKTGAQAFSEFLGRGYACGIEPSEIICTVRSSDMEYCGQEKVVLELERGTTGPPAQRLDELGKIPVRNQKHSCELPY